MNRLTFKGCVGLCGVLFYLATSAVLSTADDGKKPRVDPLIGGMQLLPGYKHEKLQGIDSIVGKIEKPGGLSISYDIGSIPKPGAPRFGGQFTDRPKNTSARHWYKEQTVNGRPMHVAHTKNGYLLVSCQQEGKGINFSVKVENSEEIAEALLMIMTYPMKK